jgi:hypothetical protein
MKKSNFAVGLGGLVLGVLINSVEITESKQFRFNNPIPISKESSYMIIEKGTLYEVTEQVRLSLEDKQRITERRPLIQDKTYSIRLFNVHIPILTQRTIQDPFSSKVYSGRLDKEGNIHSSEGVWELQSAHDASWYEKRKKSNLRSD